MIIPPFLKPGDKVGIVAPAKFISQNNYGTIINVIKQNNLIPVRGKTTYAEHYLFAGDDNLRASDFEQMASNPEIKAIFCLRGGYGTIRIMPKITLNKITAQPKWVIGFSDITVLHCALGNIGVASVHGQMPVNFIDTGNITITELFNLLSGKINPVVFNPHDFNKTGKATAMLTGGNLSVLCSTFGTPYEPKTDGKILFIEEVGEYLYRFDRLMQQLKLSGKLNNLAALIVGSLTDMPDSNPPFGYSAEQIITDAVANQNYPVAFGFPAGHIKNNYPIIIGGQYNINVNNNNCILSYT